MENGVLQVDGVRQDYKDQVSSPQLTILVEGNVEAVDTTSGSVTCKQIGQSCHTMSGDVVVYGDIKGTVNTMSGDVTGQVIGGAVSTMSGNITTKPAMRPRLTETPRVSPSTQPMTSQPSFSQPTLTTSQPTQTSSGELGEGFSSPSSRKWIKVKVSVIRTRYFSSYSSLPLD